MRGSILVLAGLLGAAVPPGVVVGAEDVASRLHEDMRPEREIGEHELRDAAKVAALIQRLDAVRESRDVLPLHALDLSLRKAVDRELNQGQAESSRGRAQRLQSAALIGSGERGLRRDEAYRTPVASFVDPGNAPQAQPPRREGRKSSPAFEAEFERRRRVVVNELRQLDSALDEAGVSARRDLLVQLLEIARQRDLHRKQREAAGD